MFCKWFRLWALALLAVVVGFGSAGAQERRIALVIGNGKYANAPHLANPAEDAQAIAQALKRLGFAVLHSVDADRKGMERSIREFGDRAKSADVAVFYFAGHAFQVSDRNLLIPTDASITEERDLRFETLDLDDVLAQVSGRTKINIVLVDACRDNPFARRLNTGTRGVRATLGPAPVSASAGTFVAFASAPGTVAEDGVGRNSPFTAAILQQIETPGLEVRQMMGRVRQSVREQTQGRQIPWENSSLEGNFYFRPPEAERRPEAATPPAASSREADLIFWESIKNSRSESEYHAYIERFPSGVFAPLARVRLQQFAMAAPPADAGARLVAITDSVVTVERTALRADPSNGADVVGQLDAWTELQATARTTDGKWLRVRGRNGDAFVPASSVKPRDAAQEEEWRRAEDSNTIEAYAGYLDRFPRSELAQLAGRRIDELRAAGARNVGHEKSPQTTAERFDPARVPLVKAGDRSRLKLYASVKREKALAISANGEFAWATQMASLPEAERIALERCEYVAGKPCSLYARNDEAQIPLGGEWKPDGRSKVLPDGRFADEIPFVSDADRRRLKDYGEARGSKALAVHPDGRHGSATGRSNDHEAQQQALARCQGQSREPCVLFAANDSIVLDKRSSRPLAEPAASMASVPLAAPASPQARQQAPARSLAYDGVWRLRVDCGREDGALDISVVNGAVNFAQPIKFGGVGSGPAFLAGSVAAGGRGVVSGSWNVERWRSNPAHTEAISLYLTFAGNQVTGYASVGPRGPCPITGRRR